MEEIKKAVRDRKKGLFVVFTSKAIPGGKGIKHGTGRSSIAKKVAERLGGEFFSTGQVFRDKAKDLGFDINEMQAYAKEHPEVDVEVDKESVQHVKDVINAGKIITADSNLLPYLIKDDVVKIVVDVDDDIRVKRVMNGARFGDKELKTTEDALEYLDSRSDSEQERYRTHPNEMYHDIDLNNQTGFHGVVDNSGELENSINQALEIIKKKVIQ